MDKTSKEKLSLIEWISECRPKSTLTKYKSITDEYLKYAQSKELRPELDVTVCSFMRYAVTDRPRKLGRTTVCQLIPAAISDYFQYAKVENPCNSPLVRQTRKVLENFTQKGTQDRSPLTIPMLEEMVSRMDTSLESVRNIFMIILMMFGFLRTSEVVALKYDDVKEEDDDEICSLSIFIRQSKTDQAADGVTVDVAATGSKICPVKCIKFFV